MAALHKPHAVHILLCGLRSCRPSALHAAFLVGGMRQEMLLGACSSVVLELPLASGLPGGPAAGAACPPWSGPSTLVPREGMLSGAVGRFVSKVLRVLMVAVCAGGTGSGLSLAKRLLEGLGAPRALALLPELPALVGAGLSAVTDPLMLAAQTHRSPLNHLEISRVGEVPCEALVGRNDAAPAGSCFPGQRCRGGRGQLTHRRLASSHPSPAAVSFCVLSEPFSRFCGCCSLKSALSFPSQNNGI